MKKLLTIQLLTVVFLAGNAPGKNVLKDSFTHTRPTRPEREFNLRGDSIAALKLDRTNSCLALLSTARKARAEIELEQPEGGLPPIQGANLAFATQNTNLYDEQVGEEACWSEERVGKALRVKALGSIEITKLLSHLCVRLSKEQLRTLVTHITNLQLPDETCGGKNPRANEFVSIDNIR